MSKRLSLALVVNPVAGIGGQSGLAGSDGKEIQALAAGRGFRSYAAERAVLFLERLDAADVVVTGDGALGLDAVTAVRSGTTVVEVVPRRVPNGPTTVDDTRAIVGRALDRDVDLIVFVGGDGTARDVLDEVNGVDSAGEGSRIAVLGIPSGVKMHSAVFARSPATAAALVEGWDPGRDGTVPADVADLDEAARRQGVVSSHLYGVLPVPIRPQLLQGGKIGASAMADGTVRGLARELARRLDPDRAWVLGPGSTVHAVGAELGPEYGLAGLSLLGVDVSIPDGSGRTLVRDCDATTLERLAGERRVQLVLSPIGGQGFLLGRGNQQLRANLLERLEASDIVVIATRSKLGELGGGPLYVDSGSAAVDSGLAGYIRVITGPSESAMVRIEAA